MYCNEQIKMVFLAIMAEEITGRLLSVNGACRYLHLSRTTLYSMIELKEISPISIGGRTLFDRKDLDDLIEKAKKEGTVAKKRGRKRKTQA